MAGLSDYINTLEKELTCSICDDILTEPKTLHCLHSFCGKCLEKWNETCKNQRQRLTCPTCRSREDGDVSKLRSSFYFASLKQLLFAMKNRASKPEDKLVLPNCVSCQEHEKLVAFCPECEGMICADCVNAHKKFKQLRDHQVIMLSDFKQEHVKTYIGSQIHCEEKYHEKCKLEYFCQACQKCICQKCSNTSHGTHKRISMEEKADEIKRLINQDMLQVTQLKESLVQELELSKQSIGQVENEIQTAKKAVSDHVQALMQILKDHENATKNILDETFLKQKLANDEEQNKIQSVIDKIDAVSNQAKSNVDYIIIQSQLRQRFQELSQRPSVSLPSKPRKRNASIRYIPNTQVTESLNELGKIVGGEIVDPSRCLIILEEDVIKCGFASHFEIVTTNSKGQPCQTDIESIDVKIQDVNGCQVENELIENEIGRYIVTYKTENPSVYQILVSIGGKPIQNSPMTVTARKIEFYPKSIMGEKGDGDKSLHLPRSLAVNNSSGEVAINDFGNNRIVIFSSDGMYLRQFGRKGTANGALSDAVGVVMYDDRIVVSDNPNGSGRLQEFDIDGAYLRTIYKQKRIRLVRMSLTDQNIVVCWRQDDGEQTIQSGIMLFDKQSGNLVRAFPLSLNGQPWHVVCINNRYFISFPYGHFIGVFDENGVFLYKFGEQGARYGQFEFCIGLAVYDRDMILVCDNQNNRLQVFTQGVFVTSFGGSSCSLSAQMNWPVEVAVAPDGKLLVLEHLGQRVQVWQ